MKFSLIICTYMRPQAVVKLLLSVAKQVLYPDEILIIDGSENQDTENAIAQHDFDKVAYYKVSESERGLTKQRNFGIQKRDENSQVICFLDDDTVLSPTYFFEIIQTFKSNTNIVGVGGVATNENKWQEKKQNISYHPHYFYQWENYVYPEGLRNVVRNYLGLSSPLHPGKMPNFSHGRTCGYPLTGKIYDVDLLIGMSMSFRASVFKELQFSTYFEGYGLYEDADFSLRVMQYGKNVINTKAQLHHYHEPYGRPNQYKYGKMVVRNGWYVWRVKNPNPKIKDRLKWHAITVLLLCIRGTNSLRGDDKKAAFLETIGRVVGWISVLLSPPHVQNKNYGGL